MVFTSVLMIALLPNLLCNRYQLSRFLCFSLFVRKSLFFHLQDTDAPQYLFDALVDSAQWFANRAAIRLIAFASHGYAGSDEQRTVNGPNPLERANCRRIGGQRVAAVHPVPRVQQPGLDQPLQNLR